MAEAKVNVQQRNAAQEKEDQATRRFKIFKKGILVRKLQSYTGTKRWSEIYFYLTNIYIALNCQILFH